MDGVRVSRLQVEAGTAVLGQFWAGNVTDAGFPRVHDKVRPVPICQPEIPAPIKAAQGRPASQRRRAVSVLELIGAAPLTDLKGP